MKPSRANRRSHGLVMQRHRPTVADVVFSAGESGNHEASRGTSDRVACLRCCCLVNRETVKPDSLPRGDGETLALSAGRQERFVALLSTGKQGLREIIVPSPYAQALQWGACVSHFGWYQGRQRQVSGSNSWPSAMLWFVTESELLLKGREIGWRVTCGASMFRLGPCNTLPGVHAQQAPDSLCTPLPCS